jgi:hypothetical protein
MFGSLVREEFLTGVNVCPTQIKSIRIPAALYSGIGMHVTITMKRHRIAQLI